jgi:hypothetical protein
LRELLPQSPALDGDETMIGLAEGLFLASSRLSKLSNVLILPLVLRIAFCTLSLLLKFTFFL